MKKIIVVLSLVLCALMLVSCGISDNPIDVQNNLEKEGYHCMLIGGDGLVEYYDWLFEEHDITTDGIESVLLAYDSNDVEDFYYNRVDKYLVVIFCEDAASAKKIEKDFLSGLDDDDWVEYVKNSFNIKSEKQYEVGRNGKVIYIGHSELIKAAK